MVVAAYDLTPLAAVVLAGALLAIAPLAWVLLRHRDARPAARLRALTVLTLFLTFDLVIFGAFTRLSDSGLGCPDWPGCYASASPLGARDAIHAAQSTLPGGPVTHVKAWIEMTHRYLATAVGALIAVLAAWSWLDARRRGRHIRSQSHSHSHSHSHHRPHRKHDRAARIGGQQAAAMPADTAPVSPWWATATLLWVCVQGAFGALTVTMKLYPLIVSLHLLGGLGLLVLLAAQSCAYLAAPLALTPRLYRAALVLAALVGVQIALGAWVSTNYAVLACQTFPTCQGSWWPSMDFAQGFTLLRELGAGKDGGYLPFPALTAIHYVHRLGAYVVLAALLWFAARLYASGDSALRRWSFGLAGVALWQLASGLGNVLLGWPLLAALAHTAGAAALVTMLTLLISRARQHLFAGLTAAPVRRRGGVS